jgi:hypothetical protein
LLFVVEKTAMNAEIQSAWIDRFIMRLSRLQVDSSTDMLVDTAFSRWVGLRNLQPEVAARLSTTNALNTVWTLPAPSVLSR